MKIKSILVKSAAVAALSVTGVVALNSVKTENVQAATVQNDVSVATVNSDHSVRVWNNYENPKATGQVLPSNSSWKVIKTAYDANGHKWYDLGKDQWVMAKHMNGGQGATKQVTTDTQENAAPAKSTTTNTSSNASSASNVSGSDASAKAWIASHESGGSYGARNGQYVGKYQLSASYLNGDYSAANQEKAADNYVSSRYGSWSAAKSFWQSNGWY
ncbi:MAG TPA: hypothetical protein DD724_00835 [Lactobacillus acetotolerans]|nr:hypothetical protein [Lactobacillus acetotolerans]